MLHAVAELAKHLVRDVERVLRDEVDADALRADQAHHLLDLLEQGRRRLVEQEMRLVEEEDELGFVHVADFRQLLEEFGEQPEQEGRIEARRAHQLVGGEDVDDALAVVGLHQVVDVEHRLTEEDVAALLFQRQQAALDGADRRRRDVAVLGGEGLGVLANVLHHRAQILEVEQQEAVVVGDLEYQLQHAGLRVVQVEQAGEQDGAHVGDRRAHRMTLLAGHIPECCRELGRRPVGYAEHLQPFVELRRFRADGSDAGQIALDVGHEHRHTNAGKTFGEDLQRDRLAGAGGAGNQTVAIGQRGQ